jgi:hypothetical protein
VSFENKIESNLESMARSFINIINSRGPRIEPCGTPNLKLREPEKALSIFPFMVLSKIHLKKKHFGPK